MSKFDYIDLFGEHQIVFEKGKTKKPTTLFQYDEFVDKFKDKKTTDDCYTPKAVYDVVLNFLKRKGKLEPGQKIIRPFFPDNDYKEVDYTGGIVVDNPPFSIFTEIVRFYTKRKIPFFLFGPHLTLLSSKEKEVNFLVVGARIVYENGAKVNTSFVSNLFGDIQIFSDYRLYQELEALNKNQNPKPKYQYPDELMTVSDFAYLIKRGVEFEVKRNECAFVSTLDDQKKHGKSVFGNGVLISPAKAKAKAKAERENDIVFRLSEREKEIVNELGKEPF